MRRALTAVTTVLAAAFLTLGPAGPASAHNVLVGSSPRDGAKLRNGPEVMKLTFNQVVQHGYDTITVTGPGGRWDTGPTKVDDRTVSVRVRPLGPAGTYTIGYRILSADGHPVSGEVRFQLKVAGTGRPMPGTRATTTATVRDQGAPLTWLWVAVIVVVAAGALLVVLRRVRNGRS